MSGNRIFELKLFVKILLKCNIRFLRVYFVFELLFLVIKKKLNTIFEYFDRRILCNFVILKKQMCCIYYSKYFENLGQYNLKYFLPSSKRY